MMQLIPGLALFIFCIYSFFREVRLDHIRYQEQDRLGDEHIMREIEKFLRKKEAEKLVQPIEESSDPL
ncbi:hypothetical protein [Flavobacterium sp.]|uniref:hypothetical protein n=1 Tax=Flavobacterium sp. TaxID=239 RepID=UPI00260B45C9|nr:hypothetical protein [Flavobacterium sp.]